MGYPLVSDLVFFRRIKFGSLEPHSIKTMARFAGFARTPRRSISSEPDFLHLIQRDLVIGAAVKLGGTWTCVRDHLLRFFERAFVVQIIGDAGGAMENVEDPS